MKSDDKVTILAFVGCYLPGFRGGGPIRTIANLVDRLGDEFDFCIVTSDRDLGDTKPYSTVNVNSWNQVGKARVYYASPDSMSLRGLSGIIGSVQYDILYLNSFFNVRFTLMPILARWLRLVPVKPVIVAPRGEFSSGALKIKRWKKFPFSKAVFGLGIFEDVVWQASTAFEKADIERFVGVKDLDKVHVATNLAASSNVNQNVCRGEESVLSVCFLSRIAPMKNLDFALKVMAKVHVPVNFTIFGPKESSLYWRECEALISALPSNINVHYGGSVANSEVGSVIGKHDLFFVPSRGENFGHVFMEALSAGVPILVSDKTPWRDLKEKNIGWDISLDKPDDFVRAIEEASAFDQITRAGVRASCVEYASSKANDSATLEMNRNIFYFVMNR